LAALEQAKLGYGYYPLHGGVIDTPAVHYAKLGNYLQLKSNYRTIVV